MDLWFNGVFGGLLWLCLNVLNVVEVCRIPPKVVHIVFEKLGNKEKAEADYAKAKELGYKPE